MTVRNVRNPKTSTSAADPSDLGAEQQPAQRQAARPQDPARVAAKLMLLHALEQYGVTAEHAGRDGTVITILLPNVAWSDSTLKGWTEIGRGGQDSTNGVGGRYWDLAAWVAFSPEEALTTHTVKEASENFAKAVSREMHCAAFTADLSWLPEDLVLGADYHLILAPLTVADVVVIANEVCGERPSEMLSDAAAAALTPRLLRLARRPAQTADAYILKLAALLDRDRAAAATAVSAAPTSVREVPTLARLHGMAEATEWGMTLAKDVEGYRNGTVDWSAVDRGLLLSGPPGVGKTLFARALANTCKMPLITGSYGQWLGSGSAHQGNLLKAMRKSFADARDAAPAILFIDEVDSFPDRATITHDYADWQIQVVNSLLAEIDGVDSREGVVLVAACNHPDKLDAALVRSGRLGDRHIRIDLPDRQALAAILREHLGNELPGEDLLAAALACAGSTGADAEKFVRGARRRARNADRPLILEDLMKEIGGTGHRTDAEWLISAVHEAGHATAMCDLHPGMLRVVSLAGNGDQGGRTHGAAGSAYASTDDIRRSLIVILAGRAAEQVILKQPTSGAGGADYSDLARATRLAATSAASFGLDEPSGLLWLGVPDAANLSRLFRDQPTLAARVRAVLDGAYEDALALMRKRSAAVKALAGALLAKRAIDGDEAAAIVARHPPDSATGNPS